MPKTKKACVRSTSIIKRQTQDVPAFTITLNPAVVGASEFRKVDGGIGLDVNEVQLRFITLCLDYARVANDSILESEMRHLRNMSPLSFKRWHRDPDIAEAARVAGEKQRIELEKQIAANEENERRKAKRFGL